LRPRCPGDPEPTRIWRVRSKPARHFPQFRGASKMSLQTQTIGRPEPKPTRPMPPPKMEKSGAVMLHNAVLVQAGYEDSKMVQ